MQQGNFEVYGSNICQQWFYAENNGRDIGFSETTHKCTEVANISLKVICLTN